MTHYWLLFTIFIRSYICCIACVLSSPNKRILYCIVLYAVGRMPTVCHELQDGPRSQIHSCILDILNIAWRRFHSFISIHKWNVLIVVVVHLVASTTKRNFFIDDYKCCSDFVTSDGRLWSGRTYCLTPGIPITIFMALFWLIAPPVTMEYTSKHIIVYRPTYNNEEIHTWRPSATAWSACLYFICYTH